MEKNITTESEVIQKSKGFIILIVIGVIIISTTSSIFEYELKDADGILIVIGGLGIIIFTVLTNR